MTARYRESFLQTCGDHRNHFASLRWMIEGVFAGDDVSMRWFPFARTRFWNLSLFAAVQIGRR